MQHYPKLSLETNLLLATFNLERSLNGELLQKWFKNSVQMRTSLPPHIEILRKQLEVEGDFWNEEELKMQFIALLFHHINLNEPKKIKIFYERPLSAILNEYKLQVVCDCLLAKPFGIGDPANPYFFLQEFKKQKNAGDAEGQMLAAMLIAQSTNANKKPVYGCYIQGKFWTFAALSQEKYSITKAFDATSPEDLGEILYALQELKHIILSELI